jgi:hypothetical protein
MPRYFFHIADGIANIDDEGIELADADAARAMAVTHAGEAIRDLGAKFWTSPEWRIWVTDGGGRPSALCRSVPRVAAEPIRPSAPCRVQGAVACGSHATFLIQDLQAVCAICAGHPFDFGLRFAEFVCE